MARDRRAETKEPSRPRKGLAVIRVLEPQLEGMATVAP
jgi:hypothetical protein